MSNNRISQLDGLAHLNELEELWASNNQLASFDEVERQLAHIESLQTVYFEGNPLQKTNAVLYRNKVRLALPKVKQIDASTSVLFSSMRSLGIILLVDLYTAFFLFVYHHINAPTLPLPPPSLTFSQIRFST